IRKRAAWRLMRPSESLNLPSVTLAMWPGDSGPMKNSSGLFPRRAMPTPGWIWQYAILLGSELIGFSFLRRGRRGFVFVMGEMRTNIRRFLEGGRERGAQAQRRTGSEPMSL